MDDNLSGFKVKRVKEKKSDLAVTHNLFIVKTARSVFGKNHDELITPTDRVTGWFLFIFKQS